MSFMFVFSNEQQVSESKGWKSYFFTDNTVRVINNSVSDFGEKPTVSDALNVLCQITRREILVITLFIIYFKKGR